MQENRSLDHYFGTLPGVRGFDDKQALRFQDGTSVFQQKDANGNIVTPQVDDGVWGNDHGAWGDVDHRKWDLWVQHNGASCMNYHSDAYMGFYHSVAAQYTIADQNFCAEFGPTDPNRKYLWSGTANTETGNSDESNYDRPWITVAEQLQNAGIDWRLYSDNSGDGRQGYVSSWIGDYGDNELKYFKGFDPAGLSADDPKLRPGTGLIWRGNCTYYAGTTSPDDDSEENLDAVLRNFHDACQPGAQYPLPAVSWIVAPYGWSEHPSADTMHGERYTKKVLDILQSNPEIWNHTLFILNYDENDGKFDHVLPPWPEAGTEGESALGCRCCWCRRGRAVDTSHPRSSITPRPSRSSKAGPRTSASRSPAPTSARGDDRSRETWPARSTSPTHSLGLQTSRTRSPSSRCRSPPTT
jgi:phospholipase C